MADLDSVYFAIDLEKAVIFNADSLPVGTNVSRLIPVLTFPVSMKEVNLVFKKDNESDTTVNYLTNPNDSIDFTHPVTLYVTAPDGENKRSYTIKVNVHKENPDSMMWDKLSSSILPSRLPNPLSQKTVASSNKVYTLIEESDHSITLATTDAVKNGVWEKQSLNLNFSPRLNTFAESEGNFWILSNNDVLYESPDAVNWTATNEKWFDIIGGYSGVALGLKQIDGNFMHCHYPDTPDIKDSPMSDDFPITGRTQLGIVETRWSNTAMAILAGGLNIMGETSNHIWGFDGNVWTTIEDVAPPALDGASLVRYVVYRDGSHVFQKREFDAWFIIGGQYADGTPNRNLYVSLDNGVVWSQASEMMDLPDFVPSLYSADAFVFDTQYSINLDEEWTTYINPKAGRLLRPSYTIEGTDVIWDCPYIYLFGGRDNAGNLSDNIWRGVIARLKFTPII